MLHATGARSQFVPAGTTTFVSSLRLFLIFEPLPALATLIAVFYIC